MTHEELFDAADQADRRFRLAELLSDDAAIYAAAAATVADQAFEDLAQTPDEDEEQGWRRVFAYHYARMEADRALEVYQASEVSATLAHDQALEAADRAIPD